MSKTTWIIGSECLGVINYKAIAGNVCAAGESSDGHKQDCPVS